MRVNYEADVQHRRDYVKSISNGGGKRESCQIKFRILIKFLSFIVEGALEQLANILPDYILPFGITVLAHSDYLDDTTSMEQLAEAEKCLKFILDPMIRNKDTFCFSLYKNMIQKMKNSKSAFQPMNDQVNEVRICKSNLKCTF